MKCALSLAGCWLSFVIENMQSEAMVPWFVLWMDFSTSFAFHSRAGEHFSKSDLASEDHWSPWCSRNVSLVSPGCLLGVPRVPPGCLLKLPGCLLAASCISPECLQMIPHASGWFQMPAYDSRWFQIALNDSRWFQMLEDGSRCFQIVPDAPRSFQMTLNDKGDTRRFQMLKIAPDASRWFCVVPLI